MDPVIPAKAGIQCLRLIERRMRVALVPACAGDDGSTCLHRPRHALAQHALEVGRVVRLQQAASRGRW